MQKTFPVIDPVATGRNIVRLRTERGMTVRDLQEYFGFEEPQAIYKWQRGKSLPTVDNLYALGRLLGVPMEQILVPAADPSTTEKWLKKGTVPIAYDWYYTPHRYFFRKRLLAVNPHLKMGAYREMDKKRFFELFNRERKLFSRYKKIHVRLEKEYRDHRKEFTSESFWRKYLEMDK